MPPLRPPLLTFLLTPLLTLLRLGRWFAPCLIITLSSLAKAQDAAPVDAARVLQSLEELRQANAEAIRKGAESYESQFRSASQDARAAVELYYQSRRVLDFEGQGRESGKFREWENNFSENLKESGTDSYFQPLLQMHLHYLVLSLKRSRLKNPAEIDALMPELQKYARDAALFNRNLPPRGRGEANRVFDELWTRPIGASPFLRAQNATQFVSDHKDWEPVPSNFEGMYERALLPYYRRRQDPAALEYWDMRLALVDDRLNNATLAIDKQRMASIERPAIQWQRAKELVLIGQPNRGVLAMYQVARDFPQHPDFNNWVREIRNILQPPPPESATESPPAAQSPEPDAPL